MADTFTNDLRLRLQESGANSGQWGSLLNDTITNIASAFSSGSEAIPNASTHTITLADDSSSQDEARSLYLKCTGGGQACTVTLAPNTVSKVWIISNETSFTLTFSAGSGANVAVSAGAVKVIVTDGAGSGSAVVDALSGLDASLSALTVDTTTLVVDATNNRVGIGTSSPSTALHVNSGAINEAARFESTDTEVTLELKDTTGTAKIKSRADFRFETGSTPSEAMRIDSSGNVGIATNSPSEKFTVEGVIRANRVSSPTQYGDFAQDNQGGYISTHRPHASLYENFRFLASNNSGSVERMRITSGGSLLVGKTGTGDYVPGFEVQPAGAVLAYRTSGVASIFGRTNDGEITRFTTNSQIVGQIGSGSSGLFIGSSSQTSGISFFGTALYPNAGSSISATDGANDLGAPTARWKDLYLSGGAYLGGVASANKLDDYEEGTWTPTYGGTTTIGTGTYSFQNGSYTKVGNVVTVNGYFRSTAHTGTGNIQLRDLPFTVASGNNNYAVLTIGESFNLTKSTDTVIGGYAIPNTDRIQLRQMDTDTATTSTANVVMDTAFDLLFTLVYRTA